MTTDTFTLEKIFFRDTLEIKERFPAAESVKVLSDLQDKLREAGGRIAFPAAVDEIINGVGRLLNVKIEDILLQAWGKYLSLAEYLDKERYPPEKTSMVPLIEHTVTSEHHPYIELLIDGRPFKKIDFTINVSILLKGGLLIIRDGKIQEIKFGEVMAEGMILCEDFVLVEKESENIPFLGRIEFAGGISIQDLFENTSVTV